MKSLSNLSTQIFNHFDTKLGVIDELVDLMEDEII